MTNRLYLVPLLVSRCLPNLYLLLRQPGLLGLFSRAALTPGASTEDDWFVVVASVLSERLFPRSRMV